MPHPANTLSLVADIGGTNTRVALADGLQVLPTTIRRYANAQHESLQDVIAAFIEHEGNVDTKSACVAVAGPVEGDSATMTNLDWTIDTDSLAAATRASTTAILNDLQAQGYALGHIDAENIQSVAVGAPPSRADTQLVVGIGTGFNAAPVFQTPMGRYVAPSESGHIDLPIRTAEGIALGKSVGEFPNAPSVEDVLSGRGLVRVYDAIVGHKSGMTGADILKATAEQSHPDADQAVRVFVSKLGQVCGNLALVQLPFGGIYLVGGMARAVQPYLSTHGFHDAFYDRGRFTDFMARFPVNVIADDYAALTGCAAFLEQNASRDR